MAIDRADINQERFGLVRPNAANHFVGERERDGGDIKPRAGGEQAREHENGRSGVLRRDAEARGQIFVDRENFVVVVRLDENVADENARDDRAEGELQVGVIAERKTFAGRAEKCAGAGFGGDEWKRAPPTTEFARPPSAKSSRLSFFPAHVQADGDDDDEIKEQDCRYRSRAVRPCRSLLRQMNDECQDEEIDVDADRFGLRHCVIGIRVRICRRMRVKLIEIPAPDFDLAMTLDSGQVFHWEKIGDGFVGTIGERAVYVEQQAILKSWHRLDC